MDEELIIQGWKAKRILALMGMFAFGTIAIIVGFGFTISTIVNKSDTKLIALSVMGIIVGVIFCLIGVMILLEMIREKRAKK